MDHKYLLQPEKKAWKQGYFMTDENQNIVYEAKVLKQSILGSQTIELVNHLSGKSEQHKLGAVVTTQRMIGGYVDEFAKRSYFKFDGTKIWDHLHGLGVGINSSISSGRLGMSYSVTLHNELIATIATSSPGGNSIITSKVFLEVCTNKEYLDIAFLTAFAIAKTDQTFYQ